MARSLRPAPALQATPSDLLLALDYPAVTNLRVTDDYYYGNSWDVGPGSLLLWSLGAAPSKDTFWTSNQSDIAPGLGGCPASGCPSDHSEAGDLRAVWEWYLVTK